MSDEQRFYASVRDVPTDKLAHNFVGQLILAKGDISKWDALAARLIRELRNEAPETAPVVPAST